MFGKRNATTDAAPRATPAPPPLAGASAPPPPAAKADAGQAVPQRSAPLLVTPTPKQQAARVLADTRSEDYYQIKTTIFSALIDTIDLAQLAQLDPD